MKKIIFGWFLLALLLSSFKPIPNSIAPGIALDNLTERKLVDRVSTLKNFVENKTTYNTEIAFLIDMRIMSGKNRFFIYNLKTNTIIDQGLVAHGLGSETETIGQLKFSNTPNSLCTSLGKYAIGKSYVGEFGKAYKLFGLEQTNNNAFQRNIVLHKYDKMPYEEQTSPICQSLGCPMVNEIFYKKLEKIIDNSKRKIILEIYY